MFENILHLENTRFTVRGLVQSLLLNAAINTAIAVILKGIGYSKVFVPTLIISQCIGFSIYFCTLAVIPLYKRAARPAVQIALIVAAVIVGATIGAMLGAFANGKNPFLYIKEHFEFFTQAVLLGLLFGSIVSYVFISLSALSREKMKRLELEKNTVDVELKLLQSQMEPHFLFNTLSNIISLIDNDPAKARGMLEAFSSFLRSSFMTARDKTVTLSQELDVVKNYLEVFTVRMGGRLRYSIDLQEGLQGFRVPPLLVQPLVENAVKHGLEPSVRGGEITIRATREGAIVRIEVVDSGLGINEQAPGNGIGLDNIRKRLDLLYNGRGRMVIRENSPSGVRASIEVPYEAY